MSSMALTIGILMALSLYLLMSQQLSRWLYGLILFSSTINLCLLIAGRVFLTDPAFINGNQLVKMGNPLPQAMVLTAIVISFALIAFSLIIVRELHKENYKNPEIDSPTLPSNTQGDDE
ncbi:sodium:proton antiporter [Legionella impletisoli]|uniref:Na(+)/H(+) antiporter subunit C1 n=1 Tax=Legionella impletisoli TaxID=343510 RepID=A0A917JYA4_9GAMM|nr:NADH-quinone oxidoreductase subunit K [Legionella impletisoli]GGI90304.1 hypothetical protein GCM10007966_18860 [Legionella impletisoli]